MNKTYLELSEFDHKVYRNYSDLKFLNKEQLENHFLIYGIKEGRICSLIRNRKDFVELIKEKGKRLEIGPLDNPQLDATSPDYYSIDVFTKEQLIKNYIDDPNVKKDKIIEPSYIIVNNDYSQIKEKFSYIFSSHNIEHMPSVVTFLNNLERILTDGGLIYLIIPDKRYCFDHYKAETTIYDVLQFFYDKNPRPKFTDILKMVSMNTHNDSVAHWNNDHGEIDIETSIVQGYQGILDLFQSGTYVDAHVSFFTPDSFFNIIATLKKLKLINLAIYRMWHTFRGSNEFYVILKKG